VADPTATLDGRPPGRWSPIDHVASGYLGAGGVRAMAASADQIHLMVWDSGIHHLRSDNAGHSWGPKTLLANVHRAQAMPSIHQSGSLLHLTWQDGRDSGDEP